MGVQPKVEPIFTDSKVRYYDLIIRWWVEILLACDGGYEMRSIYISLIPLVLFP